VAGINAGCLDREVTIEELVTEGDSGYPTETWETLEEVVFMSKEDMRGSERFRAAQLSAGYDTKWELQWRDDMDPDLVDVPKTRRLSYKGRIYDITTAVEMGRQEGIQLFTIASSAV